MILMRSRQIRSGSIGVKAGWVGRLYPDIVCSRSLSPRAVASSSRTMVDTTFGETPYRRATEQIAALRSQTNAATRATNPKNNVANYEHPRNRKTRKSVDRYGVAHD